MRSHARRFACSSPSSTGKGAARRSWPKTLAPSAAASAPRAMAWRRSGSMSPGCSGRSRRRGRSPRSPGPIARLRHRAAPAPRHEPLVIPETWGKVQEILSSRDQSGERQRLHQHYLKGTVFCARCKRRLGFLVATGRNGGKYDYFFCYGRQAKNGCDLPFLTTTAVEEAVSDAYGDIELGTALSEEVREKLLGALKHSTAGLERERKRRAERVNDLKDQRRRLVQGHLAGVIPIDLVKEERERIEPELYDAEKQLLETAVDWDTVETNLTLAMGLVSGLPPRWTTGAAALQPGLLGGHLRRRRRGQLRTARHAVPRGTASRDHGTS